MDDAGMFPAEVALSAVLKAKKTYARRTLAKLKDKEGFPLYPSLMIVGDDGKKRRVYKQEALFDIEDYKIIVNSHVKLSNHHRTMAKGYVERCAHRHQVQLSLWDLDGESVELENDLDECWDGPQHIHSKSK